MQETTIHNAGIPQRKTRWASVGFFAILTLVTLVGCPIYLYYMEGLSLFLGVLTLSYVFLTSMAITAGYHRLYAHMTYKAHPVYHFLMLFLGAATFQQSALKWSSLHRTHHRYTDTDRDPYNIKKGFFHAHVGWILFWKNPVDYGNVKNLGQFSLLMHQHNHYQAWAILAGVVTPVMIGAMGGQALGALLFAVTARVFVVFQLSFFINSLAHTLGTANYDAKVSAKDNFFAAVVTNGEGYHNYHHRFPMDYRNGVYWYHWDPTKWWIYTASKIGLVRDLVRIPTEKILKARLTHQPSA